ncbi:phytoene desaturase family protein [Amycolatopsis magusensis]|uniref:Phytoene desaturase n=1 Tax=Amycolatopsis magusensis TaxID=882444 RepID=A0ABS4PZX7_9PSEU|nr:phytoene desaturase family protein [Amycolatopsis magusensis]MBP2184419.1 phytoene desaturase [Amycolatopsis magusensis]
MARVVVIGAGMGGLAAAARLAAAGHRVTVAEAASTYGGKLGTTRLGPFTFDTGPSLLTLPQVYRDLFADTGAPLDELLEIVPAEPACHYRFADGTTFDMPHAMAEVGPEMSRVFGPAAARQWTNLMTDAARTWALVEDPVLRRPLRLPELLRHSAHPRHLHRIAPWRTLRGLGRKWLTDPRLRMLLDRYATYSGSDPRRLPAVMSVVPYIEQRFGGWYVRGGLRRLADALHTRCTELGVDFRFDTPVSAVRTTGGGVRGVAVSDGGLLDADIVVSNADATHLYEDLLQDRRARGPRRALGAATPSLSGFVLLLGLRGRTPEPRHHRVLFPADYDAEFDDIFGDRPRPVADPAVYVCSPTDPATAPEGHEAWFVLVNAPRQGPVDWTRAGVADDYADHVLAVLARRGLDVRDRIVHRAVRTPADWQHDTGAAGGSLYGTSSNGTRAAFLRPANRSPLPGLYLVGGSAHPGGGLPLVALSAKIVAGLVGHA